MTRSTPKVAGGARWLLRPPDPAAKARLFCLPYSGVGASMFAQWPRRIGGIEICPIQLPGRENRIGDQHFGSYEQLAVDLTEALKPWLTVPFAVFGHCSGALPAFETVVRIEELGLPSPKMLFVSGQVAPHDCPFDRLLDLDEDGLRAELSEVIRSRGAVARPALVDAALTVLRNDLAATRGYRRFPPVRLGCGITAIHWDRDAEIERYQLDGWLRYSDTCRMIELSGGHYDVLSAPDSLLRAVSAWGKDEWQVCQPADEEASSP
ncbi:thioesterase II family protein [Nocardia sp. NPDC056541]|uniref:thioesterase II family protein n=1 Tax=Nocardia sp. NPDC056541 TaxID=3345860 RepID=UPI0036715F7D